MSDDPKTKYTFVRQLGLLTTIPFLLAAGPLVGYFLGCWLDDRLGTEPVLMFVMLALGFAAGVREMIGVIRKATRSAEEADRESARGSGRD